MSHASHPDGSPVLAPAVRRDTDVVPVLTRWVGSWRVSLHRRALSAGELTHAYDREAYHWGDKVARLGAPEAYRDVLREALGASSAATSSAVGAEPLRALDCGVGSGAFSAALAHVHPGPLRLDAVDLSPMMLVEAEERLVQAGLAPTLHLGDVRRLPFADASFDLVLSAHMLEHLPDPARALAEMRRVLRPGGRIVLCGTRRSALGTLVRLRWRTHAVTPAGAARWLAAHGLVEVRTLAPRGHALFDRLSVACSAVEPRERRPPR